MTAHRWAGDLAGRSRDERIDDLVDTAAFAVAVLLLVLIAVL
jgi:hypothetical protein